MTWNQFIYFAIAAVLLWTIGAYAAWRDNRPLPVFNLPYRTLAYAATIAGLLVFFGFILSFWISLERPPLARWVRHVFGIRSSYPSQD